ncbi:hypothetical protein [Actibacterium sp.]|uniref:hypothetical protein n=1 Tax=Actibacterium sp. TaxID=1872125 RepID=UPI00257F6DBE|nr:hypothetical protein [Actibacterium sp.]|tara:strand:- start:3702 stop:4013 length:312 start_codon:yes stop_codon:yes gene_type:complete
MEWKKRSLRELARMICGDEEAGPHFPYRSSSYLTEFFEDCDLDYVHDGSTRWRWVSDRLEEVLALPQQSPQLPPDRSFESFELCSTPGKRRQATKTALMRRLP